MPKLRLYKTDKGTIITDNAHNILYDSNLEHDIQEFPLLSTMTDQGVPDSPKGPIPERSRAFLRQRPNRDKCEIIDEKMYPFVEIIQVKEVTIAQYQSALKRLGRIQDVRQRLEQSIEDVYSQNVERIEKMRKLDIAANETEYTAALERFKARRTKSLQDLGPARCIEDYL